MHDRGSVTVEWALWAVPAVLAVLGVLQLGLWWVAHDLCATAAQHGLAEGRVVHGTPADAARSARQLVERAGPMISDPAVGTDGTTDATMRVSVSVRVTMIVPVPGLDWRVEQSAVGVRERFTTSGAGP